MNNKPLILFTGDSITDGNRYKKKEQEWDLNHQMGHSYAYIINGILGSRYPDRQFAFRNKGVSGNRIIDLYARIDTDLLPLKPDVLSILVGVNDGPIDKNNYKPTAIEKYEKLYRMFLDEVTSTLPSTRLILLEPFVCDSKSTHNSYSVWRECVTGYAKIVQQLSKDYNAIFVPLQEEFDKRCARYGTEYWSWDGIHPTENGHGLIAEKWIEAASALLEI